MRFLFLVALSLFLVALSSRSVNGPAPPLAGKEEKETERRGGKASERQKMQIGRKKEKSNAWAPGMISPFDDDCD